MREANRKRREEKKNNPESNDSGKDTDELWINKYKPTKFYELLTDELTNRNILTWLNSWNLKNQGSKFGNSGLGGGTIPKKKQFTGFESSKAREFKKREYQYPTVIDPIDLDCKDHKILIIGGDPGTGKTVLAQTVASHCGYNVETLDANGTYSHDELTEKILFSTQNRSLFNYGMKKEKKET